MTARQSQRVLGAAGTLACAAVIFMVLMNSVHGAESLPTIQFLVGDVRIISGQAEKKASAGDRLSLKDTVTTGSKSTADIHFGDSGLVRVNPGSRVTVAALLSDRKADSQVELALGSIYCLFAKMGRSSSFQVKTATSVIAVRGTGFRVEENREGSDLAVLAGKVRVTPFADGVIHRDLGVDVDEDHGLRLRRSEIRTLVRERRALRAARMDDRVRARYFNDVDGIRKRPGFDRIPGGLRKEINDRIMKRRELRREERQERREKIRDRSGKKDAKSDEAEKEERDDRREKGKEKREGGKKHPRR